ncbi:MAG: primase-helicase family protein [Methylocella sp.]
MSNNTKLIAPTTAQALLDAGKAVRAGSREHKRMMEGLWEKLAKRFAYIASAGKWADRDTGADRSLMPDWALQRLVDVDFSTPVPVLSYGRKDGRVVLSKDSPQVAEVGEMLHEPGEFDKDTLSLTQRLVVSYWDTFPGQPRIVQLENGTRVLNLWSEPRVKAIKPEIYTEPRWFLDVVERFFGEHITEREWFLDWCAHMICRPSVKMPTSVLLISALNGAGKNFIAEALKHMVGERNTKSVVASSLSGNFQSFIPGTSLVVVSELYEAGNYSFADRLKTLQSEDEIFVNIKFGPQENIKNMCHFLAFSNNPMPVRLEEGDRRWFIFASPQEEAMSADWWSDKWQYLKNPRGGLPNLRALGCLRRWFEMRMGDIERTDRFEAFGRPPVTEHKQDIVEDSRSVYYLRLKELMATGELQVKPHGRIGLGDIYEQIVEKDPRFNRPPAGQAGSDMKALGFVQKRTTTERYWMAPVDYIPAPGMDI